MAEQTRHELSEESTNDIKRRLKGMPNSPSVDACLDRCVQLEQRLNRANDELVSKGNRVELLQKKLAEAEQLIATLREGNQALQRNAQAYHDGLNAEGNKAAALAHQSLELKRLREQNAQLAEQIQRGA